MRKQDRAMLTFFFLLLAPSLSAQFYKITDLGPLAPTAINNLGQVVGTVNDHAFMWTRSSGLRSLGTLEKGTFSRPTAINDLGIVAGTGDGPASLDVYHYDDQSGQVVYEQVVCNNIRQAFVWSRSRGMQGLGVITVASNDLSYYYFHFGCNIATPVSYATGINIQGEVVGINEWRSETYVFPITWKALSGLASVTPDAFYFQARVDSINNLGQYAGAFNCCGFFFVDSGSHAAVWTGKEIVDLGTLGSTDPSDPNFPSFCSGAFSINDRREVVGWSTTESYPYCRHSVAHASFWRSNGTVQDLGVLPGDTSSVAYKINLFGQVIGASGQELIFDPITDEYKVNGKPFIWSQSHGIQDLNTLIPANLGWALNSAQDINAWGQIVGAGMRNGQPHGFLLTPKALFNF